MGLSISTQSYWRMSVLYAGSRINTQKITNLLHWTGMISEEDIATSKDATHARLRLLEQV